VPGGEAGPPSGGDSAEVGVQVRADAPASAPWRVLVALRWLAADPLSVDLDVSADPPHPTLPCGHWAILRDLLDRGLDEPAGDAAVRLRPELARDRLHLRLTAAGEADVRLSVPAGAVRGFLNQTLLVVPGGTEIPSLLLDDLVDRLRRS
jgi:Streptomyces sporulation and cell division protein, SsgA